MKNIAVVVGKKEEMSRIKDALNLAGVDVNSIKYPVILTTCIQNNQLTLFGKHKIEEKEFIEEAGYILLENIKCPIAGNINMNMTIIKIPRTINAKIGDQVTIISSNINDPCSAYKLCSILNIPIYVLLCSLHSSIRRKII